MSATLAAKGWSAADLSKSAAGGGGLVRYNKYVSLGTNRLHARKDLYARLGHQREADLILVQLQPGELSDGAQTRCKFCNCPSLSSGKKKAKDESDINKKDATYWSARKYF